MTAAAVAMLVIAKEPVPGRCKTRLCPPLDPTEAADLAAAALADTLATVAATTAKRRVLVLDGQPGEWVPAGFDVVAQAEGGLGHRLAGAFAAADSPALLVGMDTPQLSVQGLEAAIDDLVAPGVDAVLGPAPDGGYWSIGLRQLRPEVFAGVPMSSPHTFEAQRARLRALSLRTVELTELRDFDTIDDAVEVAQLCPESRFAHRLAAMRWPAAA